jgi:hypothetical protein
MTTRDAVTHRENPFSVHRVQPGALEYLFPQGTSAMGLIDTLAANGWWGEIIGPHGSGKSTLLATLMPRLHERGLAVVHLQFRIGERRLRRDWADTAAVTATEPSDRVIVVVDGMEQLGWLARRRLRRDCLRRGWGLLATAHDSLGLPALYRTDFDLARFGRVVGRLLVAEDWSVDDEQLGKIHEHFDNDMREMLFCLYDLYEAE